MNPNIALFHNKFIQRSFFWLKYHRGAIVNDPTEILKEGQHINMAKKVGKIDEEIKCHNHTTACDSSL